MNFLAHFHLAHCSNTSYTGAFLGDFVKGHAWQTLPLNTVIGVQLHRLIDTWIDEAYQQHKLTAHFPRALRRFAGIALDIQLDHLLAVHWSQFSSHSLSTFAKQVYHDLSAHHFDEPAASVARRMIQFDWLAYYQKSTATREVLQQISTRLSRPFDAQGLVAQLNIHHDAIEAFFFAYYPLLIDAVNKKLVKKATEAALIKR